MIFKIIDNGFTSYHCYRIPPQFPVHGITFPSWFISRHPSKTLGFPLLKEEIFHCTMVFLHSIEILCLYRPLSTVSSSHHDYFHDIHWTLWVSLFFMKKFPHFTMVFLHSIQILCLYMCLHNIILSSWLLSQYPSNTLWVSLFFMRNVPLHDGFP